jgi:SAM-dependent methyltransferase
MVFKKYFPKRLFMETVRCNLCGSTNYETLFRGPDLLLEREDELFYLVKCEQCGLVYQNPRPTQYEIGQYYPQEYEPYNMDKDLNWIYRKVLMYGIEKRCRIINSIHGRQNGGRLLDVGCSTGIFLNAIKRHRLWDVRGIEISEYAAQIAKNQNHLEVFQGTLEQANYPTGFFDIVTLWDVMEHMPDPSGTLEEIYRITKPQSNLVLRVPNLDSLDAKLFGSAWAGLDLPRHYYVFSKNNLIQILENNGF